MKKLLGMMLVVVGSMAACAVDPIAGGSAGLDDQLATDDQSIIGGITDTGDPSVVAVVALRPDGSFGVCSGAVISPHMVLTAAHCLDSRVIGPGVALYVFTGAFAGDPAGLLLAVSSTIVPPGYDPTQTPTAIQATTAAGNDIGIAVLAQATSLAPLPYNHNTSLANTPVRIVGYGSNAHDGSGFGTKRQGTVGIGTGGAPQEVGLFGPNGVQDCHGDSGGPAFQTIGGVETIIGVSSWVEDASPSQVCVFGFGIGFGMDTRVDPWAAFLDANKF